MVPLLFAARRAENISFYSTPLGRYGSAIWEPQRKPCLYHYDYEDSRKIPLVRAATRPR
jgi:hypothetical protein